MQFHNIDGSNPTVSISELRSILHECGHMLGFIHEHQSPSRVHEFTYKTKATIHYYADTWSPTIIWDNVLRVHAEQHLTAYSPFDDMSIMLYEIPACINTQSKTIPRPSQLSAIDKAYATLLYPSTTTSHEATLRHTLRLVGVPLGRQNIIIAANGPTEFRAKFKEWNREARATHGESSCFHAISFIKCTTNHCLTHISKIVHIYSTTRRSGASTLNL
ncbi:hypothetical protein QCA50_016389 [Cerrena zonata]|uniref:Metalloendopeptidase n=1 Tax=Cerrena zonata TaxID=2478898 RepID=A0AAW0FTI6_9APHY